MIVASIGTVCLGAIVGWLIRYFISRFEKFSHQGLSAIIGIILGSGVIKILAQEPNVIWFYFIGLVVGFVTYHFTAAHYIPKDQSSDQWNNSVGGDGLEGDNKYRGPLFSAGEEGITNRD